MSVRTAQQKQSTQTTMNNQKSKKQFVVPPTNYPLYHLNINEVFAQINTLVSTGSINTPQGKETSNAFLKHMNTRPPQFRWTFGYIPAPPHEIVTKRVIGIDGYFFKMTTTLCGIDFIWHDRLANMFLFWGTSNYRVVRAMNSIRWRIQKCYEMSQSPSQQSQQSQPTQYTYEDISDDEEAEESNANPQTISIGRVPDIENLKLD